MKKFIDWWHEMSQSWWGAVAFYTIIPLPSVWSLQLGRIARFAPLVGIMLGGILALADWGLALLGMPIVTRSALVTALALSVTGGLHMDGAIDTADGLSVLDPQRRFEVMKDSTTGAFGVMAAVVILGLKVAALSEMETHRWLIFILSLGWARWGQVSAIALFPYLKSEGKGSFHKDAFQFPQDWAWGWLILGLITLVSSLVFHLTLSGMILFVLGTVIPLAVAGWFHWQLGGHSGDSYGAVVEWSEAIYLCSVTTISI